MLEKTNQPTRMRRQGGAALMETLISLFILAVGLLGTLAMQAKSVNSNQRAQFATDANILAEDMASRIMGYVRNLDSATVNDPDILDDFSGIDTTTSTATNPDCAVDGCTAVDQVAFDEWQWTSDIRSRLPSGVGQVAYSDGRYEITVMWNHHQIENPTTNCSGSGTDLACFTYELRLE